MILAAAETMRLLDVLEQYDGWDLIDGGEVWPVKEWVAEWSAGAEAGDRGPLVEVWEERGGQRTVVALDDEGSPSERVGILVRGGHGQTHQEP